jgi:hypothetical protein
MSDLDKKLKELLLDDNLRKLKESTDSMKDLADKAHDIQMSISSLKEFAAALNVFQPALQMLFGQINAETIEARSKCIMDFIALISTEASQAAIANLSDNLSGTFNVLTSIFELGTKFATACATLDKIGLTIFAQAYRVYAFLAKLKPIAANLGYDLQFAPLAFIPTSQTTTLQPYEPEHHASGDDGNTHYGKGGA